MKTFTLILCAVVIVTTGLPLIDSAEWWIRIFDFPRLQIAVLTFAALILAVIYVDFKWKFKLPLLIVLLLSFVYQVQFVIVYTPIYRTQAKNSNKPKGDNTLKLLVVNVRMENEDKESFHSLVNSTNPDILLISEPDQAWAT